MSKPQYSEEVDYSQHKLERTFLHHRISCGVSPQNQYWIAIKTVNVASPFSTSILEWKKFSFNISFHGYYHGTTDIFLYLQPEEYNCSCYLQYYVERATLTVAKDK